VQNCLGIELSRGPKCLYTEGPLCTSEPRLVNFGLWGAIIWLSAMKFGMVRGLEMDMSFPNLLHFGQLLVAKKFDSGYLQHFWSGLQPNLAALGYR